MTIDMEVFQQFREGVRHLGDHARPIEMSDEERVARARAALIHKIDSHNAMDLESCIHCGMCAEACHFYVQTGDPKYTPIRKLDLMKRVYRRELSPLRWLYRLTTRDITCEDLEQWQELVYDSCTECARCSMICPMGVNLADMVLSTREALADAGMVPNELLAAAQEQYGNRTLFGVGAAQLEEFVENLRRQGLEVPFGEVGSDVMVLTSVIDILLFSDGLIATIKVMNHLGVKWSLCPEGFESANFGLLSGIRDIQKAVTKRVIDAAIHCGAKTVIVPECGHAYMALRWDAANMYGEPLPFDVMYISEYLGRQVNAGRLKLKHLKGHPPVTFHDPCKVGRLGGVFEEPRVVMEAMGLDVREMPSNRETNWCCGGGAGVFLINRAASLRQKAFEIKMEQVERTGAASVVLTCGSCRLNFMNGAMQANWDKNIESLVELVAQALPAQTS
jgi:Fe-S oxidoreductase